jgi:hypothetical protein
VYSGNVFHLGPHRNIQALCLQPACYKHRKCHPTGGSCSQDQKFPAHSITNNKNPVWRLALNTHKRVLCPREISCIRIKRYASFFGIIITRSGKERLIYRRKVSCSGGTTNVRINSGPVRNQLYLVFFQVIINVRFHSCFYMCNTWLLTQYRR